MKKLLLACAPLVLSLSSHHVLAAGFLPAPVSRCAGIIGSDYAWPAFSSSWEVNLLRDQIVFALKSANGFEGPPEQVIPVGPAGTAVTLPTGWIIAMDAVSSTTFVAIPPSNGPFSSPAGLQQLLAEKVEIFGGGGTVSFPGNPQETHGGVRLPCSANNPNIRAPAITIGVSQGGAGSQ